MGYERGSDWRLQAEQTYRQQPQQRQGQVQGGMPSSMPKQAASVPSNNAGYASGGNGSTEADGYEGNGNQTEVDRNGRVAYPAQLNVKYQGQYVGKGWRMQTKYGPCLTVQLEQDVPKGGKLLIVPRKAFPEALGQ